MDILDLMKKNRTHRSFSSDEISEKEILSMIDATRYSSVSRNVQIIRYKYTNDKDKCNQIFSHIKMAGLLKWNPSIEEAATAYILIAYPLEKKVSEKELFFNMGLACQNILLESCSLGYNSCVIASFNQNAVHEILNLDSEYTSYVLIALGKATDKVVLADVIDGDMKYYRDENNIHYVPKLKLEDIILK